MKIKNIETDSSTDIKDSDNVIPAANVRDRGDRDSVAYFENQSVPVMFQSLDSRIQHVLVLTNVTYPLLHTSVS